MGGRQKKKNREKKFLFVLPSPTYIMYRIHYPPTLPGPATLVPTPRTELSRNKFLPQLAENEEATEKEPYGAKIASIAIFKVKMRPSYAL